MRAALSLAVAVQPCAAGLRPPAWLSSAASKVLSRPPKPAPPLEPEPPQLTWIVYALLATLLAVAAAVLIERYRRRKSGAAASSAKLAPPATHQRKEDSAKAACQASPSGSTLLRAWSPPEPREEYHVASTFHRAEPAKGLTHLSRKDSDPLICTGGTEAEGCSEDSRTDSSEKSVNGGFDAVQLEQLAGQLGSAHPALAEKALTWVSTLARGISPHIDATEFSEGTLTIRLRYPLSGEIATRSRVPVSFELDTTIRVAAEVDHTKAAVLVLQGIGIAPIEGASEVYNRLLPVWQGCETTEAKAEKAWEWWLRHKGEFEDTKLWRLVESLAGLRTASLIPKRGFMDILMGCICVTRSRATTLRYSFFADTTTTQVKCTTSHHPAISNPASEVYDPDAEWKSSTARDIATRNVTDSVNRELAEKFAKSGINFSLLFSDVEEKGIKGASPDVVAKLFQQSLAVGGATHLDRMVGAMKWQRDDPTFKATGDHGRVLWREATK
ncbi:hypothetical protein AB1Y20_002146 [Prymnesium parvum]|uniref:Uncharacterized protein n=1 Tax=Prymnesium parvum TaxID=97485 RepID=A0AB34J8B3_PRYPA